MDRNEQHGDVPRLALRGKAELGAALGCSEDHASTFAHEIPCVRLGRVVLYPISKVQEFLEENAERVLDERRAA